MKTAIITLSNTQTGHLTCWRTKINNTQGHWGGMNLTKKQNRFD